MTRIAAEKYRRQLRSTLERVGGTMAGLEEQARMPTGGEAGGSLSNTPLHPGDIGSEVYTQELGSTLLENEAYIRLEVLDALARIDRGNFGRCENCDAEIPTERLDALPYARYCVGCAARLRAGALVNLNKGRPDPAALSGATARLESNPGLDTFATRTLGGGTVGGLDATISGTGEPADAQLEGTTVGTPANKRNKGGRAAGAAKSRAPRSAPKTTKQPTKKGTKNGNQRRRRAD